MFDDGTAMSASEGSPRARSADSAPLVSTATVRFELTQLAREAGSDWARPALVIIGIGIAFAAFWAILAWGFVESNFSYSAHFVVWSIVLLGGSAFCLWTGNLIRHNLFPVAITAGPSGIRLDYQARKSWTVSWADPRLDFVIADQQAATKPQLPDLSSFGATIPRAPFVPGQYFPLSPEAYHALLGYARERQLSISAQELMVDSSRVRIPFSSGTVAYRIRRR